MMVVKYRKKHTVTLEFQLVFKSKLNLLLHAAQDVCEIAGKLGKVKGTCPSINWISLPIREEF